MLPWSHSLVSWIFRLRFSTRRILRRQLWLCTFYGFLATISALTWVYTVLLRYLSFGSADDATPPQCTAGEGSTGFIHRSSVLSRVTECDVALDRYILYVQEHESLLLWKKRTGFFIIKTGLGHTLGKLAPNGEAGVFFRV